MWTKITPNIDTFYAVIPKCILIGYTELITVLTKLKNVIILRGGCSGAATAANAAPRNGSH